VSEDFAQTARTIVWELIPSFGGAWPN